MAIGSEPEAGIEFKSGKSMTLEDWEKWWENMRSNWGGYLQTGYAKLIHKKEGNPFYDIEELRRRASIKENKND